MNLLDLLNTLDNRGIRIHSEKGNLKVKAPQGAMNPEIMAELKERKQELIDLLEERQKGSNANGSSGLKHGEDEGYLSFPQERIWFLSELETTSRAAYNVVAALEIRGQLKTELLERALNSVISRHEILRTSFRNEGGKVFRKVEPEWSLEIERLTLDHLEGETQEDKLDRKIRIEAAAPFDLKNLPLLRASLVECTAESHIFIFALHHIVTDDWSSGVFIREVASLYDAYVRGNSSPLSPLEFQYSDFIRWQRDWEGSSSYQKALSFWTERLEGTPVLDLSTDFPRPPQPVFTGSSCVRYFSRNLRDALTELAQSKQVTRFSLLMSAFQILLHRYTQQTDIAVGSSISNREMKETEELIGFFTNTVVYRGQPYGNRSFAEFLQNMNGHIRESQAYQALPFEKLVEVLNPDRNMAVNPLFQVCFSLLQAHRDRIKLGDLQVKRLDFESPTARFDLTLTAEFADEGLRVDVEYRTDLFKRSTMEQMLTHYGNLLENIVENPERPIRELSILDQEETYKLLVEWNDFSTEYPTDSTIVDLFKETVAAYPNEEALRYEGASLTYRELDLASDRMAGQLRSLGVGPDEGVGVCARRSISMVVSLLGALKAGGYYLPFAEDDPADRLRWVFAETGVRVILAPDDILETLPIVDATCLTWECWESETVDNNGSSNADIASEAGPDHLAYVTFTSGSTGVPKGIMIPHRGVVRLVRNTNYLEYRLGQRILELAPVSFDASTFELWGALCNGATMVIMPPEKPSIAGLSQTIEKEGITTMYLTSAMFNLMVEERLESLQNLQELLVGGDIISVPHARKFLSGKTGVKLINGYGPTETTTFAACHVMSKPSQVGNTVSIGIPISNTRLYVLDKGYQPQPVGAPGDLYIAGDGNARGYYGLPVLTAEAFVPDPFSEHPGDRMYKTGDIARYLEDGTLEFLGRGDNQVKVRGFRIELGEIENVLLSHPEVQSAAVIAKDEGDGNKTLIGFYQTASASKAKETDMRNFLAEQLPDYMIPVILRSVDSFHYNQHNKIDRKYLAQLEDAAGEAQEEAAVLPETPVQEALCRIWEEILNKDSVGIRHNFFKLGGHSLLATRIMWKIYEVFSVELPLRELFLHPTVEALARELNQQESNPGKIEAAAKLYLKISRLSPEEVKAMLKARRSAG